MVAGTLVKVEPPETLMAIATLLEQASAGLSEANVLRDREGHVSVHIVERSGVKHFYAKLDGEWYAEVRVTR